MVTQLKNLFYLSNMMAVRKDYKWNDKYEKVTACEFDDS